MDWRDATLLLIRHGETQWNRSGRYQGRTDTPLSTVGKAQAHSLGKCLAATTDGVTIISSPLSRARDTASIVARLLCNTVELDPRLVELAYGDWEGLRQCEVEQRWPKQLRQWKTSPHEVSFPGGETLAAVQQRVQAFLHDVRLRAQQIPLLAVTHEAVIRIALLEIRDEPLARYRSLRIANTSITPIYLCDGRLRDDRPPRA